MVPPRRIFGRSSLLLTAAAFLAPFLLGSGSAAAYVRSRSDTGFSPLYWRDPRQVLEVAAPALETGITADQLRVASAAALRAWSHASIDCTSVNLTLAPEMAPEQITKYDGRNRISMRTGLWCRDPEHPTAKGCKRDANALALTTVFSLEHPGYPDDGRILEADIEVNAVGMFQWAMIADGTTSSQVTEYDLTSALTHETGHFLGLDHTCGAAGPTGLIDDQGRPVPECGLIPDDELAQINASTMYPEMFPADVSWRTLSDDERNAACGMYPPTALPLDEWGGMGGCATASGPPPRDGGDVLLALAGLFAAVLAAAFARPPHRGHERFR